MTNNDQKLIFIIDDDEAYLELLANYFTKFTGSVRRYTSAKDALNELSETPDLVILDYYLNNDSEDGGKFFLKIKAEKPQTRVAILSSQNSGDVVIELLKIGVKDYLVKDASIFKQIDQLMSDI